MTDPITQTEQASLLARLRQLIPRRAVTAAEALVVAEAQADRLRAALNPGADRYETACMASLPRLRVERRSLPTSGVTYWDGQRWRIVLNGDEPAARQRFTLLHEYKHVIDHGAATHLYGSDRVTQAERAETAADYFAGCVLMPRRALVEAWTRGDSVAALATRFGVSGRAIQVRLAQLGLDGHHERCARPVRSYGEQQFTIVKRRAVA